MSNTIFFLFTFVVIGVQSTYCQNVVHHSKIIGPLEGGFNDINQGVAANLLSMNIDQDNSNQISLAFITTYFQGGIHAAGGYAYELEGFSTWNLDLQTNIDQQINLGEGTPNTGELIHDSTSVYINQNQLILENAHTPSYSLNFNGQPDPLGHFYHQAALDRAIESHNQRLIGGSIVNVLSDGGRAAQVWHESGLWESATGKLLFRNQTQQENIIELLQDRRFVSVETGFSPDDQFFYVREFNQVYFNSGTETHTTSVELINTETFEQYPADKDVAFTHDGRFYATAVDGFPSLVSTSNGKVRQRYNIDGKIMTATVVSPDDQTVYIATHTNEIYVFPSQLPTSHADGWELYE